MAFGISYDPTTGIQRVRPTAQPTSPETISPNYRNTPVTVTPPTMAHGTAPTAPTTQPQGGSSSPARAPLTPNSPTTPTLPGGAPDYAAMQQQALDNWYEQNQLTPGMNANDWIDNVLFGFYAPTAFGDATNTLRTIAPLLERAGYGLENPNAAGQITKIKNLTNPSDIVRVVEDTGSGPRWVRVQQTAAGPDAAGAGAGGGIPSVDPFYDEWLKQFIGQGGVTPYAQQVRDALQAMIQTGGQDREAVQRRLLSAREDEAGAFRSAEADLRDTLASRGLVAQPGIQQGEYASALGRISGELAPTYAGAVRDIETSSLERANQNIMQALSLAAGLSDADARNLLAAVGQGTNRAQLSANVALEVLSQNRQWNQFLAQHGLDRDRLLYDIEHGDDQTILQLVQQWLDQQDSNAGGYD